MCHLVGHPKSNLKSNLVNICGHLMLDLVISNHFVTSFLVKFYIYPLDLSHPMSFLCTSQSNIFIIRQHPPSTCPLVSAYTTYVQNRMKGQIPVPCVSMATWRVALFVLSLACTGKSREKWVRIAKKERSEPYLLNDFFDSRLGDPCKLWGPNNSRNKVCEMLDIILEA
jgi:hypothetical protein